MVNGLHRSEVKMGLSRCLYSECGTEKKRKMCRGDSYEDLFKFQSCSPENMGFVWSSMGRLPQRHSAALLESFGPRSRESALAHVFFATTWEDAVALLLNELLFADLVDWSFTIHSGETLVMLAFHSYLKHNQAYGLGRTHTWTTRT